MASIRVWCESWLSQTHTLDISHLVCTDGLVLKAGKVNFSPDLLFISNPGNAVGKQKNVLFPNVVGKTTHYIRIRNKLSY
jgi:hypothetical protein